MNHWEKQFEGIEDSVKKMVGILTRFMKTNYKSSPTSEKQSKYSENELLNESKEKISPSINLDRNEFEEDESEKRNMIKIVIDKYKIHHGDSFHENNT